MAFISLFRFGNRHAGYPDNPSTHGLVAGIWSSLSGAGRFVSRAGTGILVDHIGFQMTAVVVFSVQITVVSCEKNEQLFTNG